MQDYYIFFSFISKFWKISFTTWCRRSYLKSYLALRAYFEQLLDKETVTPLILEFASKFVHDFETLRE